MMLLSSEGATQHATDAEDTKQERVWESMSIWTCRAALIRLRKNLQSYPLPVVPLLGLNRHVDNLPFYWR